MLYWELALFASIGLLVLVVSAAAFVLGGMRRFVLARNRRTHSRVV